MRHVFLYIRGVFKSGLLLPASINPLIHNNPTVKICHGADASSEGRVPDIEGVRKWWIGVTLHSLRTISGYMLKTQNSKLGVFC